MNRFGKKENVESGKMAEQFLTLMADLDRDSQNLMSEWDSALKNAGFIGGQAQDLPFHISLTTFQPEQERMAIQRMEEVAGTFPPIQVHISHIGIFAPGNVLFGGPERNANLELLYAACERNPNPQRPWTPHVTVLIDEPETVCTALPLFLKVFHPFVGTITRLHLCAFWPMREIAAVDLTGEPSSFRGGHPAG